MVNMEFSLWSAKMTSILVFVMAASAISSGSLSLPPVNFNPLVYGIVAIGIGTMIVIWFIHEMNVSHYP